MPVIFFLPFNFTMYSQVSRQETESSDKWRIAEVSPRWKGEKGFALLFVLFSVPLHFSLFPRYPGEQLKNPVGACVFKTEANDLTVLCCLNLVKCSSLFSSYKSLRTPLAKHSASIRDHHNYHTSS